MRGTWLLCWALLASATQGVSAQQAAPAPSAQASPAAVALQAGDLERLLSPASGEPVRTALMARLVAQAQGDGRAAFYLGALFRSGVDHPAQLVERDLETARHSLQKCIEAR